jgi:hypothetical protein
VPALALAGPGPLASALLACRVRRETPGMRRSRIDLEIPRAWRKELDELAVECGLSSSDLARLGLRYLLNNRDRLLKVMDKEGAE